MMFRLLLRFGELEYPIAAGLSDLIGGSLCNGFGVTQTVCNARAGGGALCGRLAFWQQGEFHEKSIDDVDAFFWL